MPRTASATLISITRLAAHLDVNRMYLSGLIDGLGVETVRGGQNSKAIHVTSIPLIEAKLDELTAVQRG